ncbi:MAG: class I SAM-dependent methyltransferase, partial [Acidimicrobiales bacterium]
MIARENQIHLVVAFGQGVAQLDRIVEKPSEGQWFNYGNTHRHPAFDNPPYLRIARLIIAGCEDTMAKGATSTTPVATSREPRGEDLIARYRAKYGIPAGVSLTEEQVMFHWRLERSLTAQLLASTPESRWETFERCYSELYRSLPWLQEGEAEQTADDSAEHALWSSLLGSAPRDVYEVGSGDGALARYLAAHGYRCRATEITRERGDRTEEAGLSWGQTDGVNLGSFEVGESFDAVISNQVLEHLHPADLSAHLGAAHGLLRARGRIAFATPHRFTGPHDVSQVFDRDEAEGMHLHEYT